MASTLVNDGRKLILDSFVTHLSTNMKLGLFKSNTTIVAATAWGDLTACDFSGYAAQSVGFGSSAIVSGKASVTGSEKTFSHNGGGTSNTVYGYMIYDATGPTLIFAERFSGPKTMAASGDVIKITPTETHTEDDT